MDSLTHLAAGALTPLAFRKAPRIGAVVLFGIVAGEFPDIDVLAGASAEAMLVFHRSLTHSVPALLLFSVLLALAFRFILRRLDYGKATVRIENGAAVFNRPDDWSFKGIWAAALLALVLHVYLDCMTTFGTQALWPVSNYRVAVPALFIIDPFFTIPLLLILLYCLIKMRRPEGRAASLRWARRGVAWVIVYPLLCLGVHEAAFYKLKDDLGAASSTKLSIADTPASPGGLAGTERLHLAPMPLSPWKWKLLVEDRDSYRMTGLTLADIFLSWPFRLGEPYRKPDPEQWRQLREALPIFDGYARFASFPAVRGEYALKCSDLLEIDFHDLRYYPADDSDLMHKAGRGGGMFLMRLRINARNNTLAAWSYLENAAGAAGDEWVELDPPIPLGLVRW